MTRLDDSWLLHEKNSYGEIDRVAATVDPYTEHVVYEIAVEHELDGFQVTDQLALSEHVVEFSYGLIALIFVSLVQQVFEPSNCNRRVAKLYRPPRGDLFLCRHCYDLGYTSSRTSGD